MASTHDPAAHRLCGNYFELFGADQTFTACDAVALGLLSLRAQAADYLITYYRSAFPALAAGLRLEHADTVLALLGSENERPRPLLELDMFEVLEVGRLTRLRRMALDLFHLNDGMLLGAPFLQSIPALRDRPYQPNMRQVAEWWPTTRDQLALGIKLVDQTLCSMVGWDTSPTIALSTLCREFGYPDPKPVYEQWADPW